MFQSSAGRCLAATLLILLCAAVIACSSPGGGSAANPATPTPGQTASPALPPGHPTPAPVVTGTPGEPPKIEEVKAGEGDALESGGGFEATLKVWTDKFEGSPFGRGTVTAVLPLKDSPLPGIVDLMKGMKTGGVRRAEVLATQVFDPATLARGGIRPDQKFFVEMSLLKVFPDEPLEAKSVTPGKGDRAVKTGDNLRVHYTGWTDGFKGKNQFDSSQGRMPFPVKLGADQVIPGWEQGLLGMKVGEVRHLKIPHYLGYGNQDKGKIKPYSTLFFEVELVEFIEPGELKAETTKQGSGEPAKAGEKVRVHYSGWLDGFNGKIKFDSSRDPGRQPFDFNLGKAEVIPGWDKGVEGMKPGEVRRLTVPYNLAYGEPGRAPTIPPFATLYFEVEYLGKTPEAMPSPAGSPSPGGTPTP